jgi:hypothetical protein
MRRFAVTRWVTYERLDDEVLAINLETGAYFAMDDCAADCWTLLAAGATSDAAASVLSDRYDAGPSQIRSDVGRFVQELEVAGLVECVDTAAQSPAPVELPVVDQRLVYAAPTLNMFEDLQDLLLIDPIHEVDEAGWPVARVE